MEMERKSLPFKLQNSDENGVFEGYAAVFGNKDAWDDIIAPGAFAKTLEQHKSRKSMPALLWQHDTNQVIGVWESMKEDEKGLFAKGRLLKGDIYRAREAYALLKAGALSGMSIGYFARDYSMDEKTGVRTLKDIELLEASLVIFPANDLARVENVKSTDMITKRQLEARLREVYGLTIQEAKQKTAEIFKTRDVYEDEKKEICSLMDKIINKYL